MSNVINTARKSVSSLSHMELRLERRRIQRRIEWMNENYSGCDWCCGGGDAEMAHLVSRLDSIDERLAA